MTPMPSSSTISFIYPRSLQSHHRFLVLIGDLARYNSRRPLISYVENGRGPQTNSTMHTIRINMGMEVRVFVSIYASAQSDHSTHGALVMCLYTLAG